MLHENTEAYTWKENICVEIDTKSILNIPLNTSILLNRVTCLQSVTWEYAM